MTLGLPDLDDRTFEDFVEDARKRIPVHDESWTDHNAHDPGVTILETLAWVAESDVYQLDRITDDHRRSYLQLLGVTPRPPQSATSRVRLDPPPAMAGTELPVGTRLTAELGSGRREPFETTGPVVASGASVDRVVSEHRHGRTDNSAADRTDGSYYLAFGPDAERDSTLALGLDADPFSDAGSVDLFVDYHDEPLPEPASHGDEPVTFEPSVRLRWEHCTDPARAYSDDAWAPIDVAFDGTTALYESGRVRLVEPDGWDGVPFAIEEDGPERRWLRCRVAEPGHEIPPQIDAVSLDVVPVAHRRTIRDEELRRLDGGERTSARPNQTFAFEASPVLEATVAVGGREWTEVETFAASGPDDPHYVLDRAAGRLTLGDEVQGRAPEPDQRVVATSYVAGGGEAGNVPGSADWRLTDSAYASIEVVPTAGAAGGRGAESLDDAFTRLQRSLRTPFRAVTRDDVRYVATHTPGLRVARATAVLGSERVADCPDPAPITVVVVPYVPPDVDPRPEPSDGFLEAVRCHLQRHRLVTDEIDAAAPTYVGIDVAVECSVASGYVEGDRRAAVADAIASFLHPIDGYDGSGWPFGRPIYPSELYETVESVEGVDCVYDVSVGASGDYDRRDGAVILPDTGLPASEDHEVTVRSERERCGRDP